MTIGILFEGKYDKKALEQIIRLIVQKAKPTVIEPIDYVSKKADGSILGYIVEATSLFFQANQCDFAVYVSDVDEHPREAKKKIATIKGKCKKHIESVYPNAKYVLAFPKPELEEWFLFEEDALRKVLKIPPGETIKYASHPSKERLKMLINDLRSVVYTEEDLYELMAKKFDLDKLLQNPSFSGFYSSLDSLLNS